jgi:hypothetical protein
VELAGWPYWVNQLTGESADGGPVDRFNDCGPASVRAVGLWLGKPDIYADDIRDRIKGDGVTGYTYAGELAWFMREIWGLDININSSAGPSDLRTVLASYRAVIALTQEPQGYNHWTPVTGYDAVNVYRHQVMGGGRETLTWAEWTRRFLGWLIVVTP